MKTRKTAAARQLDSQIEQLYYKHGTNVPISLMEIPAIYAAGRAAHAAGADIETAIVAAIEKARR